MPTSASSKVLPLIVIAPPNGDGVKNFPDARREPTARVGGYPMHVLECIAGDVERSRRIGDQHPDVDVGEMVVADGAGDVAQVDDERNIVVVARLVGAGMPVEGIAREGDRAGGGIGMVADRLEQRARITGRVHEIVGEREMIRLVEIEVVAVVSARRQREHAVSEGDIGGRHAFDQDMRPGEFQAVECHQRCGRDIDGIASRPVQNALCAARAGSGGAVVRAEECERLVDRQVFVVGARVDDDGVAGTGGINRSLDRHAGVDMESPIRRFDDRCRA